MVSVDEDKHPEPNIHYVFLEETYKMLYSGDVDLLEMSEQTPMSAVFGTYDWFVANCEGVLASKGLDVILNYPDDFKFDAVIYDFSPGPCLLPLIHKFKYPPLVSVTPFSHPVYSNFVTGGHKYPAFVPHYTVSYPQVMTYTQRVFNHLLYAVDT